MSNKSIKINSLSQTVNDILNSYTSDYENIVQDEINNTADEVLNYLSTSSDVPDRTGKYKKSFYKKDNSKSHFKSSIIANKLYQLTHLLEYGHMTRTNKGRTKAFPHWEKAQKIAEKITEKIERRLKNDT